MFEYYQGYEIDGSDTSFNVIVPERQKIMEIVDFFSRLPLFQNLQSGFEEHPWAPHREEPDGVIEMTADEIKEKIAKQGQKDFFIIGSCLHPSQLESKLKQEIYALSDDRFLRHEGLPNQDKEKDEGDWQKDVKNDYLKIKPSMGLTNMEGYLDIALVVSFSPVKIEKEYVPEGYLVNAENYVTNAKKQDAMELQVTCGPTFIYEYAAYVMTKLSERFPEISIDGGLDCDNGFLYGCTYCMGLYDFEIITVDVDSVIALLKALIEKNVLYPCKKKKNKYRTYDYVLSRKKVTLMNAGWNKDGNMTLDQYAEHTEQMNRSDEPLHNIKSECALMFSISSKASGEVDFDDMVHITSFLQDQQWRIELHVPYRKREEIVGRLNKAGIAWN